MAGLQALGWIEGRDVRIDYRFAAGKADLFHRHAAEIVTLAPDVILNPGVALPPVFAGHARDPSRLRTRHRSSREQLCREPFAARWQRHWLLEF